MSKEEKYTLEMNGEEIDALIIYLEHFPDLVNADNTNLIIMNIIRRLNLARRPSTSTSNESEAYTITKTTKKSKTGNRGGTGTTSTTRPPTREHV